MTRLEVEFTTEPFEGERPDPPPHAVAARDAVESAGLRCDFGPLGTSMNGSSQQVLDALNAAIHAALEQGATRMTVRVDRVTDDE
ncbi:Uncharacterized conserved protein YqgV, UPF0045/DUF77 family [Haloechinothrix alba]|uniref:Uncharacterized conserved protein YqgV, UPF0045/DUF77 family n=1 Tax=Haloechinothrix alba TaxID=664784 RepID=A0A238YQ47_9PSEU|nr:thiamine-binding protein [Haloechinothrix alba]SNR73265.1 Uncharacterized conserved protein YqgV, UPF0045/DUF77 family [Haloechinothrix alba]